MEPANRLIAFETGRIRPPSEATSILLRLTRGCHWNQCAFCPVYRDVRFSIRKPADIKRDIDAMAAAAEAIRQRTGTPRIDPDCWRMMAFWMHHGLHSVFLQDADALVLPTDHLVDILNHLRAAFPSIQRITSYSRAKTVSRKSPEEWHALRQAGLSRVHVGMESGSDAVLALMHKGVTAEEQVRAGRLVVNAGIELSEYFMPGLGGRQWSKEHAIQSAEVLTAVNPAFLRIRTTVPIPGTELYSMMTEGQWAPQTEEEKVRELRECLDRLEGVTCTVKSDHMMNLLDDVEGTLPADKQRMLAPIERFLALAPPDREAFIVGRRIGRFHRVSDYVPSAEVERVRRELVERFGSSEEGVRAIVATFV